MITFLLICKETFASINNGKDEKEHVDRNIYIRPRQQRISRVFKPQKNRHNRSLKFSWMPEPVSKQAILFEKNLKHPNGFKFEA